MSKFFAHFMLILAFMGLGLNAANAQTTIKGTVVDSESGEPLIGATIMIQGTSVGTTTDYDGVFTLPLDRKSATIVISYVGYLDYVTEALSRKPNLGTIELVPDAVNLSEVAVFASIIINDKITPVPISNILKESITEKLSNQEFPEILKSTPSVYVTKGSGGFGDSRINMRGFDSSNIGVLINGVPINGMENGKVYWSNWSGLSDVTEFIQVQRGLGASKLGLSSVGGTMNMVTTGTESEKGGSFFAGLGNDGYRKTTFSISTGMMDNGWSVTFAGGLNTGDGYVYGTNYEGWNYFGNISKKINDSHKLSLTAFGAPQWHNQRATPNLIEDIKNSPEGRRLNQSYGYINSEIQGGSYGRNHYHKPQISLNHLWNIDEKQTLTTSAYVSLAKGGGRRSYGDGKNKVAIDYNTGRPYEETYLTPNGLLDYDRVMAENASFANGSDVVFVNDVNDHDWYGLLSSYRNILTDELTITAGFDGRYYKGYHYREIEHLLGGEYFVETGKPLYGVPQDKILGVGDKVGYNNTGEIVWAGVFAQAEYVKNNWSAFASTAVTEVAYRYINPGGAPIDGKQKSKFVSHVPWSIKGGVNYNFAEYHNVFFNGGYFTRAPYFNAVFPNYNIEINDAPYERIMTYDLGYGFSYDNILDVKFNAYYTTWMDKFLRKSFGQDLSANIKGLNALHYGVELEATYRPTKNFRLQGMFSWGDWTWKDDVNFTLYDDNQNPVGTFNAYTKGVHVGNAAQMTASLSASYEVFKGLRINADYLFAGKNYADFNPANRTEAKDAGVDSWKMPNFYTIDLGVSYRFDLTKDINATIYSNVNNLTNNEYIADAKDGITHTAETALVYFGFGTTWSTGLKINF